MTSLTSLKNIGETSAAWLESVGIKTAEELHKIGVVEAYRRVRVTYPDRVTFNMLYALQGAVLGVHWKDLPLDMKADLRHKVGETTTERKEMPRRKVKGAW
jgi:DNA transformation protein